MFKKSDIVKHLNVNGHTFIFQRYDIDNKYSYVDRSDKIVKNIFFNTKDLRLVKRVTGFKPYYPSWF